MIIINLIGFAACYGRYYSNHYQNIVIKIMYLPLTFILLLQKNPGKYNRDEIVKTYKYVCKNYKLQDNFKENYIGLCLPVSTLSFYITLETLFYNIFTLLLFNIFTNVRMAGLIDISTETQTIKLILGIFLQKIKKALNDLITKYRNTYMIFIYKLSILLKDIIFIFVTFFIVYSLWLIWEKNYIEKLIFPFIFLNTMNIICIAYRNLYNNNINHNNKINFLTWLKNPLTIVKILFLNLVLYFPRYYLISSTGCDTNSYEIIIINFFIVVNFMTIFTYIITINKIIRGKIFNIKEIYKIYAQNCSSSITVYNILFLLLSITIFRFLVWNLEHIPYINLIFLYATNLSCEWFNNSPKFIENLKNCKFIPSIVYIGGSGSGSGYNNNSNPGGPSQPGGPTPNNTNLGLGGSNSDTNEENNLEGYTTLESIVEQIKIKHINCTNFCEPALDHIDNTAKYFNLTRQRVINELLKWGVKCKDICAPRDIIGESIRTSRNPLAQNCKNSDPHIQELVHTIKKRIIEKHLYDLPKLKFSSGKYTGLNHSPAVVKYKDIKSDLSLFQVYLFEECINANPSHFGSSLRNNRGQALKNLLKYNDENLVIFDSSRAGYGYLNCLQSIGLNVAYSEGVMITKGLALPKLGGTLDKSYFKYIAPENKSNDILKELKDKNPNINVTLPQSNNKILTPENLNVFENTFNPVIESAENLPATSSSLSLNKDIKGKAPINYDEPEPNFSFSVDEFKNKYVYAEDSDPLKFDKGLSPHLEQKNSNVDIEEVKGFGHTNYKLSNFSSNPEYSEDMTLQSPFTHLSEINTHLYPEFRNPSVFTKEPEQYIDPSVLTKEPCIYPPSIPRTLNTMSPKVDNSGVKSPIIADNASETVSTGKKRKYNEISNIDDID